MFSPLGCMVICSLVLPGSVHIEIGMPSRSMNSPICTIGSGLFFCEFPVRFRVFQQ